MRETEEFDTAMAKAWKEDEDNKLPCFTEVRLDSVVGFVVAVWKDVDGFYLYDIETYDGVIYGAYTRKDLVVL